MPVRPIPADVTDRRPRVWAAVAVAFSIAVAAGALATSIDTAPWLGALVAIAVLWPTATVATAVLRPTARRSGSGSGSGAASHSLPSDTAGGTIGVIVRLGDEPLEVARTTVLLNKSAGVPVAVIADRPIPPELTRLGVVTISAETIGSSMLQAFERLDVDSVLIVSGRAVAVPAALDAAAAQVAQGAGWVIGRSGHVGGQRFLLDPGEQITARLRVAARDAGAQLWEPDAVVVARRTIEQVPLDQHRSYGAWLRADIGRLDSDEMDAVVSLDTELSQRAEPVDASTYWPSSAARHRARARDSLAAMWSGRLTARCAALGLATYELSIVPAVLWLSAPVWVTVDGRFPFAVSPVVAVGAVLGAAVLRWIGLHTATGIALRPAVDLSAAAHRLPGSFGALFGRNPGRSGRVRTRRSGDPLALGGLICTLLAGWALVSLPAAQRPAVTVAVTSILLAALWWVVVNGLSHGHWERTTYRLPVQIPARVAGVPTTIVDAGPSGIAVVPYPRDAVSNERAIEVEIDLDDGTSLACTASMATQRTSGVESLGGLRLWLTDQGRERWIGQLGRAGNTLADDPVRRAGAAPIERVTTLVVGVVSISVIAVLILVVAGFQPRIIRSESMLPTLDVGDVVITQHVEVSELHPGDIASIPSPLAHADSGELLTHRVVEITAHADGSVEVITKGDHNAEPETTVLAAGTTVGSVRATVPGIGRSALWLRTNWWIALTGITVLAGSVAVGGRIGAARRRRRRTD